jgi:L-fuconolactonase
MYRIDAHQHFWDPSSGGYRWLAGMPDLLARAYGPDELAPQLAAAGIDATVLVQADGTHADTESMLAAARAHDWIVGVVGWLDLLDPADTAARAAAWAGEPLLVGMRHQIHDEPDPRWLLQPAVLESLTLLAERSIPFDVVAVLPEHLELVPALAARVPGLRMVVDHLGKPPIAARGWEPWATRLREAAAVPGVHAKLSGLDTAADPAGWSARDLRRYVDHALDCFGPQRLMFGGDWPVLRLAGEYAGVVHETEALLRGLPDEDRAAVWAGTAIGFYGLEVAAAGAASDAASAASAAAGTAGAASNAADAPTATTTTKDA